MYSSILKKFCLLVLIHVYCLCVFTALCFLVVTSIIRCLIVFFLSSACVLSSCVACLWCVWLLLSRAADCGPDYVCLVCTDHDGCHRGYHFAIRRGRHRFSLGHLPHRPLRILLHSSLYASAGIQVYHSRSAVSPLYSFHVPPSHYLLPHQSQQRLMGNS